MALVEIIPSEGLVVSLAYATPHNFLGFPLYTHPHCFLHSEAAHCLEHAFILAQSLGLGLKIFDAFRPQEAQKKLWKICPDPQYVADPQKGSSHSRGVAVDLTLIDVYGYELEMGTHFDDFTPLSHHGNRDVSPQAQRNRFLLLGIMTAAGWDFYQKEWWHYQLFNAKSYALLSDQEAPKPLMGS